MYVNSLPRPQTYRSVRPHWKRRMPYQGLREGLYLIKQKSERKGMDHYGILDIGNYLNHPQADGSHPIVVHQTPPSIRINWFKDTGKWTLVGKIIDEDAAIYRLQMALNDPTYDLFGNNCEHFARYIATGNKESRQLQSVGLVSVLAAITIMTWRIR